MSARIRPGKEKRLKGGSRGPVRWLFLVIAVVVLLLAITLTLLRREAGFVPVQETPTYATSQWVESVDLASEHIAQLDLGMVPIGQWVEPTFRVRNGSQSQMTITIPWEGVLPLVGC